MKKYIYPIAVTLMLLSNSLTAQWQSLGSGITPTVPEIILCISAVNQNVVWAVAVHTDFTATYDFTVTTDGGTNWNAGKLPDTIGTYYPLSIFGLNAQTAWVSMIKLPNQNQVRMYKTTDGGANWQEEFGPFNATNFGFGSLHFFNANEGIGFGSSGTGSSANDSLRIFRTSNGGDTWTRIPSGTLPTPLAGEGQWVFGNNRYESYGDTLWFCTRKNRVFRTTDKGLTWEAFNSGISGSGITTGLASIAFQNSLQGIVTTYDPCNAARTIDGGTTWTTIPIPNTYYGGDIEYVPGTAGTYLVNEGFANSGTTSDFLITTDGGDTWNSYTDTTATPVIQFLSPTIGFGGGRITSATVGGMYKWTGDLSDSSTVNAINALSVNTGFTIYPNPATSQFEVTTNKEMNGGKIIITSMIGSTVFEKEIASEKEIVPVTGFSKGMYFVNVLANGSRAIKRMVVE